MRRVSWKCAAKKKKFCAALMISLLLGGACFLRGEAAPAEPARDGNPSGTERSEEIIEDAGLEAVEPKTSAAEPSENEMPDSGISEADGTDSEGTEDKDTKEPKTDAVDPEASGTESTGSETPKSDLSGKENSNPEDPEAEVRKPDGTKSDGTELKPSAAEPSETDTPKSETSNQKEPETQQQAGAEPEKSGSETPDTASPQAEPSAEQLPGLTCLQIPEKLEIVIDPWEIDGKTQIYSEPFRVKNTGNALGVLILSFTCKVNEEGGVSVRKTREGLHDSEEKQLYIKVILDNEEEVVFTEEEAQCKAELLPGEELSLWFEGEVNENAEEPWIAGDLEIEGKYTWEEGENQPEEMANGDAETGKEADSEETQPSVSENGTDVSTIETEKEPVEKKTPSAEQTQEPTEEETSPVKPKKEPDGEAVPPVQTEGETAGERTPAAEPEKAPAGETDPSAEPEPDSAEEAVLPAGTEQESDQDPNIVGGAPGESPEGNGLSENSPEEE